MVNPESAVTRVIVGPSDCPSAAGRRKAIHQVTALAANASSRATAHGATPERALGDGPALVRTAALSTMFEPRSAIRASPMSRRRVRGSLSRHRRSNRVMGGGMSGWTFQSGSSRVMAESVSVTVSREKAGTPVSISYSTHPNAQMSVRRSTGRPRACSGDMYARVPMIMPASVAAGVATVGDCDTLGDEPAAGSMAFARPKSSTLAVPSERTLIFAGLRSRWTMPCSCAASSASAICLA